MSETKKTKEELLEIMDPNSSNFLGSGMSMLELLQCGRAQELMNQYGLQDREEKKRRLKLIVALSVELARIRSISPFCTALGESAIETVITGEFERTRELARDLTFAHEDETLRNHYAPIWEQFVGMLEQASQTLQEDGQITASH